ncbi:MAG: hypothetical protein A2665_00770 [Candidatus Zambryskibacteria bacterium RIFCSPHIGHO2_01_FULL_46_30]|uniref:DUF2726 domain-containing protein n=1 Tax=Candidatus Zambryskibacteria bacterium RIFCSPHIGHO2_01_FULL_46_30 TaxID=1802739 RepID=A0A1G2T580_9BACT|nr:MAG: hypothetical protein A3H83_01550 [Candidatus Roizmanbacteria bacterium RIFCSPLOWO2_02_FULL_39_8]OHA91751.1 MAG: hypothetical protein A2665_00770 [Candidatus Zambryskibacteria bacterium RIFCSPHIGHO2_01_FULL_46_30]OHB06405.1 MAG: hypothetical protein A3B22_02775 [Candidatus Zambryskibacteria bacterium RIFCSPLOWO2_01_FULL_47_33]
MLQFFLIILAVVVVVVVLISRISHREKPLAFKQRDRVMNSSEQALFINLQKVLGERFIILSKVRIEDFVEVVRNGFDQRKVYGNRARIKSRHVDFLICEALTTKPVLAIELDGNSHYRQDRRERDNFVNELYSSIGLRVEHVLVGSDFENEAFRIRDSLITYQ